MACAAGQTSELGSHQEAQCTCASGFGDSEAGCTECEHGFFKAAANNTECSPCPGNIE